MTEETVDTEAGTADPVRAGRVRDVLLAEEWAIANDGSVLWVSGEDITVELPLDDAVLDAIEDLTSPAPLAPDDYDDEDEDDDEDDDELAAGERAARLTGWKAFDSHWENLPAGARKGIPIGLAALLIFILILSTL